MSFTAKRLTEGFGGCSYTYAEQRDKKNSLPLEPEHDYPGKNDLDGTHYDKDERPTPKGPQRHASPPLRRDV